MNPIGFDNERYLREQTAAILERVGKYDKLYLEFGGKLMFDYHAARILPGYDPNIKLRLLQQLKEQADVVLCIYAGDIERKKMRADFGITYDADAMKLMDDLHAAGVSVVAVVITRYDGQPSARQFKDKLERRGVRVITHSATKGYPANVDLIVSEEGYGANARIETTRPLVVVTGPGPGSGKLGTCLTMLYHDRRTGKKSGYAKFETFPIWNLPLKHPVNIAYEAATADLRDYNLIDPFHLERYGAISINYNRDVEAFPLLRRILEKIVGEGEIYASPTDMGVNRAGFGIVDDAVVRAAATQEVVRRFLRHTCEYALGLCDQGTVDRCEMLMKELNASPESRSVVAPARAAAEQAEAGGKGNQGVCCGAALRLRDGRIVTGKNSPLMHAASSVVLNAIKTLAGLPDKFHLLSPTITASIGEMKRDLLNSRAPSLSLDETLIALCISSATNPAAQEAMTQLPKLSGCEMHITHIPTAGDEAGLRRLGLNLTTDPNFPSKHLFVG